MNSSAWVPMEWPSAWRDPSLLKLLEGTPINCLLLPKDAAPEIRTAAEAQKIQCPPGIKWSSWKEADWRSADQFFIADGVWPELSLKTGGGTDSASSGPTGAPWLDANGWLIQLARARAAGRPVWLRSDPPENPQNLTTDNYLLALAEAATFGAVRPLWLAPTHAQAIAGGNPSAAAMWKRITQGLHWHLARGEWTRWPVLARLVIASDFSGPNEYTASETLLLAARRNLAFQPVESARVDANVLMGRRAVLYLDAQPMPAKMAAAVQGLADWGGLVICLKAPAAAIKGLKPLAETHPRFDLFSCGKGRVAICKGEWDDPYILAQDTHLLLSRRHDAVRLFNAGSLNFYATSSIDGRRWLVQILNYSRRGAAHQVSLQTWQKVQSARFHSPESGEAIPLELHREPGQQEVYLPQFKVYGAVELELTPHA